MNILTFLTIILVAFIVLFKNISFVIVFSPILKLFFYVKSHYLKIG